jgi:uncharacterized protein YjbI with pentapeptide repeats
VNWIFAQRRPCDHVSHVSSTYPNLSGAILSGTDLSGANLSGADFSEAYLGEGANLREANLNEAILLADLRRATGLSANQLAKADGDAKTRLSAELVRPAHWPAQADPTSPDPDAA